MCSRCALYSSIKQIKRHFPIDAGCFRDLTWHSKIRIRENCEVHHLPKLPQDLPQ